MNTFNEQETINQLAASLEHQTLDLIQNHQWDALDDMIAQECQFVTHQGVYDKQGALSLMKHMALRSAKVSDVKASLCGDNLIISFRLACSEMIDGLEQSKEFSPRLSIWKQLDGKFRCIAYGDFAQP